MAAATGAAAVSVAVAAVVAAVDVAVVAAMVVVLRLVRVEGGGGRCVRGGYGAQLGRWQRWRQRWRRQLQHNVKACAAIEFLPTAVGRPRAASIALIHASLYTSLLPRRLLA